ncbi:glutathione peroxidase [Psychrobacillus vulpis]|uniref:Glutathione peroxidase n=1 Tax=Psychrobacillus vulpis TaxID=2325572 RepID=A0A544TGJ9_9BACI|nr:glutathione peroxidase [Psychrobacillus vulpis]TQR16584.1 glutathione peroxidase [Psychrobacillus vulpis]
MTTVYDFSVKDTKGENFSLDEYKGKVLLIVNTASHCGFTPQFTELQKLYDTYKEEGLIILGFPCNQFNNQEFEDIESTIEFCQLNHGVRFPMFAKIDVKGSEAHPLFQYLVSEKKGFLSDAIKWNFTKFLIDKEGRVINRYAPQTSPLKIEEDIKKLLR